jgi:hypothetical protein
MRSPKVRGVLWIVAATPMLIGPTIFDGNPAVVGIGILFLVFGLVTLGRT